MQIFESKWFNIVFKLVVVLVLIVVIGLVWKEISNNDQEVPDNVRFSLEYTQVSKDNMYKYASKEEVLNAFDSSKAVVLFGFPECKWCQTYVKHLEEVAKEFGATEILYYNIKEDRQNDTDFYKEVVSVISEHLFKDEEGNPRIYVPDVYFIKNKKIVGHNNDTSMISGMEIEEYYTEENTTKLKNKLESLFETWSYCSDKTGC